MKCRRRAAIGYKVGEYVMSGQEKPRTQTTRSAKLRPRRVKWYGKQWVFSTKAGSIIGLSETSRNKRGCRTYLTRDGQTSNIPGSFQK